MTAEPFFRRRNLRVACVIWALSGSACSGRANQMDAESPPQLEREGATVIVPERSPLRARLQFSTADREQVRRSLSLPAAIEPDPRRYARVYPPVAGRLVQLHVQLGDQVRQGQVVASLHAPDLTQAQHDYLKARSALRIATSNLERQRDLLAHKIAAQRDLEQAQNEHEAAQSDLQSAASRLKIYAVNPEHDALDGALQLLAPIDGRVVELDAALGEFRNDSNAALMTIADLSTVWLTAGLQEKDLRFAQQGQEVRATLPAYPNETFVGKVERVADVLDPATRTVKIRVRVANDDGRLKPGMFAKVELMDFPQALVTVPSTAIVQAGDATVIYEQVAANGAGSWRLEPRQVTLGPQLGERTVVLAGLDAGASIVAREGVLLQR
jgi:membrane fusion protein, heavy metal efflux system